MERVERTLRRLALNDERSLRTALAHNGSASDLDAKTQALIRLGALLSIGAATVSVRYTVELATAAGLAGVASSMLGCAGARFAVAGFGAGALRPIIITPVAAATHAGESPVV